MVLLLLGGTGCDSMAVSSPEQIKAFEKAGPITPEVDVDTLLKTKLHIGPYRVVSGDLLEFEMPSILRAVSTKLLFDTFRKADPHLARVSDYFVVSESFANALAGPDNPLDACHKLAELGPRVVGVTMGAKGYIVLAEGRILEKPAYPVEAVDTTGCGDAFHAGISYGIVQRWDVDKTFDFAAWAAAMVSRKLGGRAGIPTIEQVASSGF